MTTYGHGATRIDLNGPYGTMTSLIRIGDYWATLLGMDRIAVALSLTNWHRPMSHRLSMFAHYFGEYATLYEGSTCVTDDAVDPFSSWPFERRRPHGPFPNRFPTMPSHFQEQGVAGQQSAAAWIEERTELETAMVEYLLEDYGKHVAK